MFQRLFQKLFQSISETGSDTVSEIVSVCFRSPFSSVSALVSETASGVSQTRPFLFQRAKVPHAQTRPLVFMRKVARRPTRTQTQDTHPAQVCLSLFRLYWALLPSPASYFTFTHSRSQFSRWTVPMGSPHPPKMVRCASRSVRRNRRRTGRKQVFNCCVSHRFVLNRERDRPQTCVVAQQATNRLLFCGAPNRKQSVSCRASTT